MEEEQPQLPLGKQSLNALGERFPWLPWLLGASCVVLIFGYRYWISAQQKVAVQDCLQVSWEVQKAQYRYFKVKKRYGSREDLQGKGGRLWLKSGPGWQLDLHCPYFSLKTTGKGAGFLLKARPRGQFEESCLILADHRGPPKMKGKCG